MAPFRLAPEIALREPDPPPSAHGWRIPDPRPRTDPAGSKCAVRLPHPMRPHERLAASRTLDHMCRCTDRPVTTPEGILCALGRGTLVREGGGSASRISLV